MHKKFNHEEIEKKWQKSWKESGINHTDINSTKEKLYVLDMFPYPSGEGLHVGHPKGYIATDIYSRFKNMSGYEVLHPMGWDAFGLPAENFALKHKIHPRAAVEKNIENFKSQLAELGFNYDWSKEINTTDPEYYKWTQWIFLKLLEKDLAYESYEPINWCPSCQTGLANEDLESDGTCERCGSMVEKKPMRQWVLKITKYADRMLEDLETLTEWPEHIKEAQRQWIGRSQGAQISFELNIPSGIKEIVFATNNKGKVERMRKLAQHAGLDVVIKTPEEIGITDFSVEEDQTTLEANVEKKAKALSHRTDLPVFADDTGFFIEGTEIDPVTVKRNALNGIDESSLSIEEIAQKMQEYYKDIATAHGGKVDAEWKNVLCFAYKGTVKFEEGIRPVILTNEIHGDVDPHLPVRGLYITKATGKYALEQNNDEELLELTPIADAFKRLLTPAIEVFTTRPDTLYGATYMVLAPEHPWVTLALDANHTVLKNKDEVLAYVQEAKQKSEIDRTNANKEKTGVELQGIKAINPASGKEIPVFIADYVLAGYGTGAIMAVPAHDERDFAFAKKFNLPITQVVAKHFEPGGIEKAREGLETLKRDCVDLIIEHPTDGTFLVQKEIEDNLTHIHFVGGGTDGESDDIAIARELEEETGFTQFKIEGLPVRCSTCYAYRHTKNKNQWTKSNFYHIKLKSLDQKSSEIEEGKHSIEWLSKDEVTKQLTWSGHIDGWNAFLGNVYHSESGSLINSNEFDGMSSGEAKIAITKKVSGTMLSTYRLNDWVFSRQRYWGEPIPVIHCETCGVVPVPESELPVLLPEVEHYEPTGTGESPLANIDSWVNVDCPKCGKHAKRETNTMPQWAGSSWYYLRFADPKNPRALLDPKIENEWLPVDVYVGGDHAVRHLIYARFWHKFLYDIGVVHTIEPFNRLEFLGFILATDGRKMSKRWGNIINPSDIVKKNGADTLRVYEMFMGPFENTIAWSTDGLVGAQRFLERVYGLNTHIIEQENQESYKLLHKTILKVGTDIEQFKFNTAISALMIYINQAEKTGLTRDTYIIFLQLLAPFAPHISEELWSNQGETESIHKSPWPKYNPDLITDDVITLSVQINGKMRGTVVVPFNSSENEILEIVKNNPDLGHKISTKIHKIFCVPNKIINVILEE